METGRVFTTLCLALILASGVPAAEFAGGTGQAADPYQIATVEQLISIGADPNLLNKHFTVVDDIDLDPNLTGGHVFTQAVIAPDGNVPGSARPAYTGRFYGNGHTLRHLTIVNPEGRYLGLFGSIGPSGRIYDLGLEDVRIEGTSHTGGLAGFNEGACTHCSATGRIQGADSSSRLGGLVGVNLGGLRDCHADIDIAGGDNSLMLGGLAGLHRGAIIDCNATGGVSGGAKSFYLGGLVGACLEGRIEGSHACGPVLAGDRSWSLGGLAGRADLDSPIAHSYATGPLEAGSGSHNLGGLIGSCLGGRVANSYASGPVTGGDNSHSLGGLLGSCLGVDVTDCYATGRVSGHRVLGGLAGLVQTGSVLTHCYAIGRMTRGDEPWDHGGLVGQVESPADVRVTQCFWDIEASEASRSPAGTGLTTAQMQNLQTFTTAGWDLTGDRSDGTADTWHLPEEGQYPVLSLHSDAYPPHVLEGTGQSFDPYQIATAEDLGAMARYPGWVYYKLVADIDLAEITWHTAPIPTFDGVFNGNGRRIRNLTLQADTPGPLGLFARIESNAWVYNLGVEQVSIAGPKGSGPLGGLAGTNAGNVFYCYVTGNITAGDDSRSLGGLVGSNGRGLIADCYTTAGVSAAGTGEHVGGLVGTNYMGTVANCYATGPVSGTNSGTSVGPLAGRTSEHAATVDAYYLAASDGGGPNAETGLGLTDKQMKQQVSFAEWDFEQVWMNCEGAGYPHFQWENVQCDSP